MAAYGALVSLMNDLELIPNHPTHSFSFDNKQITSLSQIVHFLIDFMETYDPHGCTREAAATMERRIASAAHAAHDVVETHVVDQLLSGTTRGRRKSRSYFLLDLQKAIDNIDYVKRKVALFKEKSGLKPKLDLLTYSAPASSEPLTSKKNVTVGCDAVVVRLLEMLTGEPSGGQRRVIPIVGMGGLGKTTLTRNVYEHVHSQKHFDVRLWATISQEYSVENILNELLSQNSRNVSELGLELHKTLWGRRYLIVLDDMWSVEAWDEIQMLLPENENGSCVIVTTRLSDLAARLSSDHFEMDFLDDDQSWELFCGKTFGEEDCPNELEEIGKKIVRRCRGLPLSIIVIGGHLKRASREIDYWKMVANLMNPISGLGEDDQCLEVISLSYEHLPACLKPCFLYLGIYREDAWIDAPQLLKFWIAEGFVKGKADLSLEEVAEDYLKDLIDMNLILVRHRRWNGKVEYFVIHDIVRELCLKVAQQENFLGVLGSTNVIGPCRKRRIVVPEQLSSSLQPHTTGALQLPFLLRSLICEEVRFIHELSDDLRLLRVCACVDSKFMIKIDKLFHRVNLRYHDGCIDSSGLFYPIQLSMSLWNIQTLVIQNSTCVPDAIWEMTQLRHLEFVQLRHLLPDPHRSVMNEQKCVVLENLHTLLGVESFRLTEEDCRRMPNIKNLKLFYSDYDYGLSYSDYDYGLSYSDYDYGGDCKTSSSDYCLQNLSLLIKLESLACYFDYDYGGDDDDYKWRDVVQNLVLPTSLEELSLWNCHWEDLTRMMKSLPRLGRLCLYSIRGTEWDFIEEEFEFPRLKILEISSCGDLIDWNANSSHFPVLESLYIACTRELSEIPFDIGEIPTLRAISLVDCSVSAAVSAMRIVVEQESLGNEDLLLTVHFWEMEQLERFRTMMEQECLMTNNLHLSWP